jgi:predicted nucleic acid-binding protein
MDKFELEIFRRLKVAAEKEKRLLTPTTEDWWEAAKIVSRIRYGQKSDSYGLIPKDPHAERIQNDALIARTVYTTKCTLVTNNIDDFNRIKPFCKIKFVSGKDFFGY